VLLQAKKLFPSGSNRYTLNSSFSSFHAAQREKLKEIERRFSAENSIFYLWYSPASEAFAGGDAKIIQALEAAIVGSWREHYDWHPFLNLEGRSMLARPEHDDLARAWRMAQPATRISGLRIVDELTASGRGPQLSSFYQVLSGPPRHWRWPTFEPLADLFLLGLMWGGIGHDSDEWLRLARGERVAMPPVTATADLTRIMHGGLAGVV
jgi:hypothetical protein